MKVIVVGPGAMGLLFSAFLKKAGNEVYLLDKNEERAKKISEKGIKITGISGEFLIDIPCSVNVSDFPTPDFVIIAVKSYDTQAAMENVLPAVGKDTLILSLQNGIGNLEKIAEYISSSQIIGGVTSQGATLLGIGEVKHAGLGETVIGPFKAAFFANLEKKLKEIASVFKQAGIALQIVDDIFPLIWGKLIINVGINAITAITHLKNGMILKISALHSIMKSAVREAVAVAQKKAIELPFPDAIKKVEQVCDKTADNISSMLQDILKGKRTEIDSINGAIVKEAEAVDIDVPVNKVLYNLVKALEGSQQIQIFSL